MSERTSSLVSGLATAPDPPVFLDEEPDAGRTAAPSAGLPHAVAGLPSPAARAAARAEHLALANRLYRLILAGEPLAVVAHCAVLGLAALLPRAEVFFIAAGEGLTEFPVERSGGCGLAPAAALLPPHGASHRAALERGETVVLAETARAPHDVGGGGGGERGAGAGVGFDAVAGGAPAGPPAMSLLDVPILHDGRLAAVLRAAGASPRAWTQCETAAAAEISQALAAAVSRQADGRHNAFLESELLRARRLEAIAEAANMADQVGFIFATLRHELGNPVNSVKTALTVLQRHLADYPRETVAQYLERSLAEISRMEYLLRAFKALGAFERLRIESVDLAACLEDFVRLVRPDLDRRGIAFETAVAPGVGTAAIDPRAFNQVLLNLVTNAADAVAGRAVPRVRLAAQVRGRRLEVRVEDNGAGIAPQDLGNLFRPFFSTKPGGTGLGLAIVRKLLSKMSSSIEVESEHGAGTAFTLSLPTAGENP